MSYKPDYIHMQNIIIRAVESVAMVGANGDHEAASAEFAVLIDFLEHMYCNSIIAMAGAMLQTSKEMNEAELAEVFKMVRTMLEKPPKDVFVRINKNYQEMVSELKLPDAYEGEKRV